ncbi:hypothetical protein Hanom_Chr03g00216401 [Helianthus anomalus]
MDGVNEPDENTKILNLLDPDAENKRLDERQNWPNLLDENDILLLIRLVLK